MLTFYDHGNIKIFQPNLYSYSSHCHFFRAQQCELLSLISRVTQVDHYSPEIRPKSSKGTVVDSGAESDQPTLDERITFNESLFSVPTNQAAPPEDCLLSAGMCCLVGGRGADEVLLQRLQLSSGTGCSRSFNWITEYCTRSLTVHLHTTYGSLQVFAPTPSLVIPCCKSNYTIIFHGTGA